MTLYRTAHLQGNNSIEVVLALAKATIEGATAQKDSFKLAA
jgi:hypothetical protein